MTIIIGVDPGSRITGYGIIKVEGSRQRHVDSGCIKVSQEEVAQRLFQIHKALEKVIELYKPQEAAVEKVFVHANPSSAIKLGQARGAAIVALGECELAEYTARQVKQSVVGYGNADKDQVQHMVMRLLNLNRSLQSDEADALAVALCHAQFRRRNKLIEAQYDRQTSR